MNKHAHQLNDFLDDLFKEPKPVPRKERGALLSAEECYRQIIQRIPAAMYTCDAEGRIMFFNESAVALWGRRPQLGEAWCGWYRVYQLNGQPLPISECPMAVALRERRSVRGVEIIIERPDGVRRNVLPHPDPLYDQDGNLIGAINMLVDITERKQVDFDLAHLAAIVASSDDAIISKDPEGIIMTFNAGAERIFGYRADEVIGRHLSILLPPDGDDDFPLIMERLRRGERVDHYETVRRRKDGTLIHVSVSTSPLYDTAGRLIGASKVARDITAHKRLEQTLRESEERFRTLTNSAPVLIWVNGLEGCQFINRAYQEFLGVGEKDIQKYDWARYVHPEDREDCLNVYFEALGRKGFYEIQHRFLRHDGQYRWMKSVGVPRFTSSGEFLGYVGSTLDITDLKETSEALKRLNSELEDRVSERTLQLKHQSDRLRLLADQVAMTEQRERKKIAAVIHNHLQQILVACKFQLAQALRNTSEGQKEKAGRHLQQGDEFLDEAIRSAKSLTAELRPPILYEGGLIAAFKWLAKKFEAEHNLAVSLHLEDIPMELPDNLKILIFEAGRELLFNVVKYAGVQEANLMLKLSQRFLYLCVEDQGAGFEISQMEKFPLNKGFGLFSIRERLRLINARFDITSRLTEGTRVEIQIPIEEISSSRESSEIWDGPPSFEAVKKTKKDVGVITILLVDDHHIVREGIANLLNENFNLKVIAQAEDGQEAVERMKTFCPDVILMDINLPKINGIEATRIIKKEYPKVHIIGLSVQDEYEVAESMKEAGAVTLLNKAGDPEELIQTIIECSGKSSSSCS